jgi:methionyl-tRNA formyltransferase
MKIIYFGTPKFSAEVLSYLFEKKVNIIAIVTQKDYVRNDIKITSEVKKIALKHLNERDIFQPEKASDPKFLEELKKYKADLYVVVAYGQILSQNLLDIPNLGCINVHASLLPKYRGAAPIHHSILNGDKTTGISIQKLVRKMDAGPIIVQKEIKIKDDEAFTELHDELCSLAKPLLYEVIQNFQKKDIKFFDQDESKVTFAHKITKELKEINFENEIQKIYNQIRAFANEPGAFCKVLINGNVKELKIFKAQISDIILSPKEMQINNDKIIVGCKNGSIEILEVQLEGKKRMKISEFIKGIQNKISFI